MNRKAILVVGGAGYIGSHVTKVLVKQGYIPVILDDLSTGHRGALSALPEVPFYQGCASNRNLVTSIVRNHNISSAMHFSAKALVGESVQFPLSYYDSNVSKTISLLEALHSAGVRHFVFSSTCATYGEITSPTIQEDLPQNPINPYGKSKLMVEQILKDCASYLGIHSCILRYFNAAGADPEGFLGEDHRPETHLIPIIVEKAIGRRPEFMINGNDYPTPDGTCIRDYIHVNDLADGHIQALEYSFNHKGCEDFNLGTGKGHSNLAVLQEVERVVGHKIEYKVGPRRPGDPPCLIADPSKARRMLGWHAQLGLTEIIESTVHWMKKHPQGYQSS